MNDETIIIPEEDRILVIAEEKWVIDIPPEWRTITVLDMPLVSSKPHTAGDSKRWFINYEKWLDNAASIVSVEITSSSPTCTVQNSSISGPTVVFFLVGGELGEVVTVSVKMRDNFDNIKNDTIRFTVVAP